VSAICIIPARGGSVRIPRKNIKLFHGKPIIQYSIDAAEESGLFDEIVVSTDDDEIANLVCHSVKVHRRPLCDGTMGTQEVTRMVLASLDELPDIACCLYATAPLVQLGDLQAGFDGIDEYAEYAISVGTEPLRDAGQFYFGRSSAFMARYPLIDVYTTMIPIDEDRVIDINTPEDWAKAERMYEALHHA
jgi:N-acylneuraminate cytidylyltransferase